MLTTDTLAQLEAYSSELGTAVKTLANYYRNVEASNTTISASTSTSTSISTSTSSSKTIPLASADAVTSVTGHSTPQPPLPLREAHKARRSAMDNLAKLQTLLNEPSDFLQQLSGQNQLLSCLQWLGEFQVLACIPLSCSVPLKDVAELTGVPETQLSRVVRMMATSGFLHEPQPGHISHTALSAPFVTKPSFLDAAMFLSEIAAPAALKMAGATQRFGNSQQPNESAYNVAFNTSTTFASVCEQRPKLQRQWPAYLQYGMGDLDANVTDILTQLDWPSLGNTSVVEVGARSCAIVMALADLYPALRFIVQMSEPVPSVAGQRQSTPNGWSLTPPTSSGRLSMVSPTSLVEMRQQVSSRITVEQRAPGSLQTVSDAAVYILHLPSPSPGMPSHAISAQISAELRAHISVLRASSYAALVLTACLLPEPGTVNPSVEGAVRLRDLSLLQLGNEQEITMLDLMDMINNVRDSMGQLVLVNKLYSPNNAIVAFEIRYQIYNDCRELQSDLGSVQDRNVINRWMAR